MNAISITAALGLLVAGLQAQPAPPPLLQPLHLEREVQGLKGHRTDAERLRRAQATLNAHRLSSLQVKAMAAAFADDQARLEFALAAYPATVDPENFYEVYDAFSTFSKVFRLHDQIRRHRAVPPGPVETGPQPLSQSEFAEIKASLARLTFDTERQAQARQILTAKPRFLARQVKDLLSVFDFDNARLEVAKLAYDATLDKENYFLVNDAFEFPTHRNGLSQYVESRRNPK